MPGCCGPVFRRPLLYSCGQTALLKAEVCVGVMRSSCSCALFLSRLDFFAPAYGVAPIPLWLVHSPVWLCWPHRLYPDWTL